MLELKTKISIESLAQQMKDDGFQHGDYAKLIDSILHLSAMPELLIQKMLEAIKSHQENDTK